MSDTARLTPPAATLDYVPLGELAPLLPRRRGRPIHRTTPYDWAATGQEGIRLRTVRLGGRLCTRVRWVEEWAAAVAAARDRRLGRGGERPPRRRRDALQRHGLAEGASS